MGFPRGHKGFKGKAKDKAKGKKFKAGSKEKVSRVLVEQAVIYELVNDVNRETEIPDKGGVITNAGVNNREVANVIMDQVRDRIPKYRGLIKEAEEEGDSEETVKKIIELCGIKGKCSKDRALKEINEYQDIYNLLRVIATALVSDAPKTKKAFLDIVRKERQVNYENYRKDPLSKKMKLIKKGAMELRRVLAKEINHTEEEWTLPDLWDEIADLYVRYRNRKCLDCEHKESGLGEQSVGKCEVCRDSLCSKCFTMNLNVRKEIDEVRKAGVEYGSKMFVAMCSYCRRLGAEKVSGAFKDQVTRAAGGDIQAFGQIKAHRDGVATLPFVRSAKVVKRPSKQALSVSMKETDEEEAYVSIVMEDIAPGESQDMEKTLIEGVIEKMDTVLGVISSGGMEGPVDSSTPGSSGASNHFRNESMMRQLGSLMNIATLHNIYRSLYKFTNLAMAQGTLSPTDQNAMIGIHEIVVSITGGNPVATLGLKGTEGAYDFFHRTFSQGYRDSSQGSGDMGPAESTKVNTEGIGGRQFLDFQDETTHQGGSGWEDQEEEDETREGESECEVEENEFF